MMSPDVRFVTYTTTGATRDSGGGVGFGKETGRSGFHVIAEKAESLVPWLDVHRRLISSLPDDFLPESERPYSELVLGRLRTKGKLFSKIVAGIQVDIPHNVYDISTTFAPTSAELRLDRTFSLQTPPLDIATFEERLREDTSFSEKYDIPPMDVKQRILTITPRQVGRHSTPQPSVVFGPFWVDGVPGFRLNIRRLGVSEANIAEIDGDMSMLAELTAYIGEALYHGHNVASEIPNEPWVIKPPDDTDRHVRYAEAKLVDLENVIRNPRIVYPGPDAAYRIV